MRTPLSGFSIDICARVRFRFQVRRLYVRIERLLLPEGFLAWRVPRTIKFGLMNISMSLEAAIRGKCLVTSLPVAGKVSDGFFVRIL